MRCDEYLQYGFSKNTYNEMEKFLEAKEKYIEDNNEDNLYEMKWWFYQVHCSLKAECSSRHLSIDFLNSIVERLKNI